MSSGCCGHTSGQHASEVNCSFIMRGSEIVMSMTTALRFTQSPERQADSSSLLDPCMNTLSCCRITLLPDALIAYESPVLRAWYPQCFSYGSPAASDGQLRYIAHVRLIPSAILVCALIIRLKVSLHARNSKHVLRYFVFLGRKVAYESVKTAGNIDEGTFRCERSQKREPGRELVCMITDEKGPCWKWRCVGETHLRWTERCRAQICLAAPQRP